MINQNKFLSFAVALLAVLIVVPVLFSDAETFESITFRDETASLDSAMYITETVAGKIMDMPRPAVERESRLQELMADNPGDFLIVEALAQTKIALKKESEALQIIAVFAADYPDQFKSVAGFYRQRLLYKQELETLYNGASKLSGKDKAKVLEKIVSRQHATLLNQYEETSLYEAIISAEPDSLQHVLDYARFLRREKQLEKAADLLKDALGKFTDKSLKIKSELAQVYQQQNKTDDALALYDDQFRIDAELTEYLEYKAILRQADRLTTYQRTLRKKARTGDLTEPEFVELVLYYRSEDDYNAARGLLLRQANQLKPDSSSTLLSYARALSAVNAHNDTEKFAYQAYLTANTDVEKSEALRLLIKAKTDQLYKGTATFAHSLQAMNPGAIDSYPGFAGGIFSLLYNSVEPDDVTRDLGRALAQQEQAQLITSLFNTFASEYKSSDNLAKVYSDVIKAMRYLGRHDEAIAHAESFFNRHSSDPHYNLVAEAVLPSYRAGKKDVSMVTTWTALINWADKNNKTNDYYRYIADLSRHYTGKNDMTSVVKLYWQQIQIHPDDQSLYARFLNFLDSYRIFEEQEKVYKKAIAQFEENDYYDKLARWYLRQKKNDQLRQFTREVADIFEDSELYDFLRNFANHGRKATDADAAFYKTIFEYANKRFPRNMNFVTSLLNYYKRYKMWPEYEALAFKYFYADGNIRRQLLAHLSKNNALSPLMTQLQSSGGDPLHIANAPVTDDLAGGHLLLSMATQGWQSYFESSVLYAEALSKRNPGYEAFQISYAELLRSLEQGVKAEQVYSTLASLKPTNKDYLIKAGELAMEREGVKAATIHWLRLPAIAPDNSQIRNETATLFWDYYQYDKAIEVLQQARKDLDNQSLFGMDIGILLEEKNQYQAAIDEYIHHAMLNTDSYSSRNRALDRLKYLADTHKKADLIFNSFAGLLERNTYSKDAVTVYNAYLTKVGDETRRRTLLVTAVQQFDTIESLNWLIDQLRSLRMVREEETSLLKLAKLNDNAPETMLALASLYERSDRTKEAETIYVNRVSETETTEVEMLPDFITALRAAAEFYWRNGLYDGAVSNWKTLVGVTESYQQKQVITTAINRLNLKKLYDQARWFGEKGLEINPTDSQFFNAMASIHSAKGDYASLNLLFKQTIEAIRSSSDLGRDQRKARIQTMRFGLIDNLQKLGDFTAALDQYIELINAEPEALYLQEQAFRFASEHKLTDRLVAYYEKTAEKSFKDYRWHRVLASFARIQGKTDVLINRLERSVSLEPQRLELREDLSTAYMATGQYEKAADQFDQMFRLDKRNLFWQQRQAEVLFLAGDQTEAVNVLKEIVAQSPDLIGRYFEFAELTRGWKMFAEATAFLEDGIARLKQNIYLYSISERDMKTLVDIYVQQGEIMEAFDSLLELNILYGNEANRSGNNNAWQARQGQTRTYNAFSENLGPAAAEYGTFQQKQTMETKLRSYLNGANTPESTWNWVKSVASVLHLSALEEDCLKGLLAAETKDKNSSDYRERIHSLVRFYQARNDPDGMAEMLEAELSGMQIKRFATTMLELLADAYYFKGDTAALKTTLNRYWQASASRESSLTSENEFIERYLNLLHKSGDSTTLRTIAAGPGLYAGQIISFLARNGYNDLVIQAISALEDEQQPAWINSKKMLMGMKLGLPDQQWLMSSSPADLMRDYPINRRVNATPPSDSFFSGNDWYQFVSHYADYYLASEDAETAYSFINSLAEESASSTAHYRAIAEWYTSKGLLAQARKQLETAFKLAPKDVHNFITAGKIAIKDGSTGQAVAHWYKILDVNRGTDGFNLLFDTLKEHNLYKEAARAITTYINTRLGETITWQDQDLLYEISSWAKEQNDSPFIAKTMIDRSRQLELPLELLSVAYYNTEMSDSAKVLVIDEILVIARQLSLKQSVDDGYATPALKSWLEEAIQFADRTDDFKNLKKWIGEYEDLGYDESPTYRIGSRSQFRLLKAKAMFATGETDAAMQYVKDAIDEMAGFNEDLVTQLSTELKKMDMAVEARQILIHYYWANLNQGYYGSGYQLKLAELLFARQADGDNDKALGLIETALQDSVNDVSLLLKASEILEKYNYYLHAVLLRSRYQQRMPQDYENQYMLAIAQSKAGQKSAATKTLEDLMDQLAPQSVQITAVPLFVELLNKQQAAASLQKYFGTDASTIARESHLILCHALAQKIDDTTTTASLNSALSSGVFYNPSEFLAWIGGTAPYINQDVEKLQQSLELKPDPAIAAKLFRESLASNKPVYQYVDEWQYSGLMTMGRYEFQNRFKLINRDLVDILKPVVERLTGLGQYNHALQYEELRREIGNELGMSISDATCKSLQNSIKEMAQEKEEYNITDSVSNK